MNNLDFLNQNTLRNYPIKDGLSRISKDGLFTIPNELIADLTLSSVAGVGNEGVRVYISKVVNTSTHALIEVYIHTLGVLGTFNIPNTTAKYTDVRLIASNTCPTAAGILTVGDITTLTQQPTGEFSFDLTASELLPRIYFSSAAGINYLMFRDLKDNRISLTGAVNILAETNLRFRDIGNNAVALDAGDGLGLNEPCDTEDPPIKTINGIKPDNDGNFTFVEGTCISIEPAEFGLVLNNTCGKPCVGCNEVGTLTDRLVAVESDLLKVRDYVNNLQGLITQLTTLVNYQCECE